MNAFACGVFFWMAIEAAIRAWVRTDGWYRAVLDVALCLYFAIAWLGEGA